jgi:hypothetical protein
MKWLSGEYTSGETSGLRGEASSSLVGNKVGTFFQHEGFSQGASLTLPLFTSGRSGSDRRRRRTHSKGTTA